MILQETKKEKGQLIMENKNKDYLNAEIARTEDITQYIKIIKNSKGYNWEIKINTLDLKKLYKLNDELVANFDNPNE